MLNKLTQLRSSTKILTKPKLLYLGKTFATQNGTQKTSYAITTPIFYVNAGPHLGHMHSLVLADSLHRVHKLTGAQDTIFSTGTDEHGLKVQQAARVAGQSTVAFCNNVSYKFQEVCRQIMLSNTCFIRTTDDIHKKAVSHFWRNLQKQGHIYQGCYEGWYCIPEEAFLSSAQLKEINDQGTTRKVSAESNHPVEWMQEENYMFALSKFKDDLYNWVKAGAVKPKIFADILIMWIKEGLTDLSVSRPRSRVKWGIPVPDDDSQTIYVWLDALVNYLTVGGYPDKGFRWPVDCHVIGKDILRFHGIYWPAFLIAANLEPPRSILCHSHWTVNDEKMSKSKGNVISASDMISKYSADGLRYFLLREATLHSDANYTEVKMQRILNAELADNLGNLLSRCCAPSINKMQQFPHFHSQSCPSAGEELIKAVMLLPETVQHHFLDGNFYLGINCIMDCLRQANAFIQHQKPWELAKLPNEKKTLDTVLHIVLETLKSCGILLQPIVPTISDMLLTKLGVDDADRMWTKLDCFPDASNRLHPQAGKNLHGRNVYLYNRIRQ